MTFPDILARTIAAIVVVSALGFSLAFFARLLGDSGPSYDGRLTANPLVHIDFFALVGVVTAQIGWTRKLMIDPSKCRLGRWAPPIIGAAALATILLLGWAARSTMPLVALYWPADSASFVALVIRAIANTAAWSVAFNLLPIPPLVGGYLLQSLSPTLYVQLVDRFFWISLTLGGALLLTYSHAIPKLFGGLARLLGAN
ncbi:hypothetical protein [Devosia sp. 2618]|uniref:hypothetical protein n=1 Tax=Devosia sp. 2618 TaxID=3156454 RepID=UPI00339A8995